MSEIESIQVDKSIVESLNKIKEYPKQSYGELITHMIDAFKRVKVEKQHDEFLHKIQRHKMKELWDNEYDEEWENV